MKREQSPIPHGYGRRIRGLWILHVLFTFGFNLYGGNVITVGIFVDPELGDRDQLFRTPLVADIVGRYEQKGYEVAKRSGTVETILHMLICGDMKEMIFIGRNPLDSLPETSIRRPTLAGLTRQAWEEAISKAFETELTANEMPPDQAREIAAVKSRNLGIDAVYNYSSNSLANTTIADLFVRPEGKYYGSLMKYSEEDMRLLLQTPGAGLTEYIRTGENRETVEGERTPDRPAVDRDNPDDNAPEPPIQMSEEPHEIVFLFNMDELGSGPSWGSGLPREEGQRPLLDLIRMPGEAAIPCYMDRDVMWQWTGSWERLLRITEGVILEYHRSDLSRPVAKYERDTDKYGHFSEERQRDNRLLWTGKRTDLKTSEATDWRMIWH